MSSNSFRRAGVVAAQVAAVVVALGCESGLPTVDLGPSPPPTPGPGIVSGTVTHNGEASPVAWVALYRNTNVPWEFATTLPDGHWEWNGVPAGDHAVVIKTPPGLTCDAMRKSVTVRPNERTVVEFACDGDIEASIQGFAINEFGTMASARILVTGPVNREQLTNADGFFAFEDLPPGEYSVGACASRVTAVVRDGTTAYVMVDCS